MSAPRLQLSTRRRFCALIAIPALLSACSLDFGEGLDLSKHEQFDRPMHLGERWPDVAEASAVGALESHVERGSAEFARLVRCDNPDIVFKDEEGTGADRMMTPRLRAALKRLAPLVTREWPDLHARVTEAWDEKREHGANSIHYEGRAADITTSDVDPHKLGRLARLAREAGFDWVFYEDGSHVHVSVKR
jgi:hypothetical protein